MAYQILENASQHGQGDELVCFTQSVIKMEREISQIPKQQKDETCEVQTFPESICYTPECRRICLDENIDSRRSIRDGKSATSERILGHSRQKKQVFASKEAIYESAPKTDGILDQHTYRSNSIWTPPQAGKHLQPSDCNITLSRVYFAQGSETRNDQVTADVYDCPMRDPETIELPKKSKLADEEKNNGEIIVPPVRQSSPYSLNSSVAKPSPLFAGKFQNPHPAGRSGRKYKHREAKRFSSENQEYIYFLPDYQEYGSKPINRDTICCSKPYSNCNEYSPPNKRPKSNQEVPEMVVISDEDREVVGTSRNLLQVVTDRDGRIQVNIATTPTPDRQHVEVTNSSIASEENLKKNHHGDFEQSTRDLSKRNCLKIDSCSSEIINIGNQKAEFCNHTSALITNDHRWDAWKRANCVPPDENYTENSFYHHTRRDHCRTVPFGEEERYIIGSKDENCNNNNSPGVDTHHLNKFLQTSRHGIPDNSMISHAKATKQSFVHCLLDEQTTERERRTERLLSVSRENCLGNYQSLLKNNQRCAYMDKHDSCVQVAPQIYRHKAHAKVPLVGVRDRRTTCIHDFRNRSVQAMKKDKCETSLRQERAVMKDNQQDVVSIILPGNKNNDVQTSCPAPRRNKRSCIETTPKKAFSLQPTTDKKNSLRKEIETRKVSTSSKTETFRKSSRTELGGRYQCDWPACDKTFRHYSFLVLHKRIHTGERPYVCSWDGCTKQFRRSDDYQRHYRVHTGAKPYACKFCGKGFKRSDHRLFHYRAIHHMTKNPDKKEKKKRE